MLGMGTMMASIPFSFFFESSSGVASLAMSTARIAVAHILGARCPQPPISSRRHRAAAIPTVLLHEESELGVRLPELRAIGLGIPTEEIHQVRADPSPVPAAIQGERDQH